MSTCPLFNDTNCRFHSMERIIVPYAPLVDDKRLLRLVVGATQYKHEEIGSYCNNVGDWTSNLKVCGARWALSTFKNGKRAEGCGKYSDEEGQKMIVDVMKEEETKWWLSIS